MEPKLRNRKPAGGSHRRTQRCRHLTALKHGLNSGAVLLPGDNVEAFRTLRHREFRLYRPRNVEEARCVETIVAGHWRIARCRVEQQIFKRHLGAVLSGHPDVTGVLIDADPHRLHHRATDCGLEERRLEKSIREAKTELALLQKHRAQNLIVGTETELQDYTVFVAEGEPRMTQADNAVAEDEATVEEPRHGNGPTPAGSSDSTDGDISKSLRSGVRAPPGGFPVHGSRQQREAQRPQEGEHRQSTSL